jgi:hypothetical protein
VLIDYDKDNMIWIRLQTMLFMYSQQ